jgi:hypothetical protein
LKKIDRGATGALGIIALVSVYLCEALKLPFGSMRAPGPSFMPVIASIFTLLICAFNVLKSLLFHPGVRPGTAAKEIDLWEEEGSGESQIEPFKAPAAMFLMLAYVYGLGMLGFLPSTFLLTYLLLLLMRFKNWRISLIAAAVIVAVTYVIFELWMGVRFPSGFLG